MRRVHLRLRALWLLALLALPAAAQDSAAETEAPPPEEAASSEPTADGPAQPAPAGTAAESAAPAGATPARPDTITVDQIKSEPQPETAADSAAASDATRLDEIMVTAQKRVESLQSTPISIAALNKEKLEFRGIESLADLGAQVPAMTVEPFPTHNATLRIFIRGIGVSDAQVTQDPAVGIYLDGVYIARSVGLAFDIADLERIEVLRGPQGTLYGRNTTGGAVNLITKRPTPGAFFMEHQLTGASRARLFGKSSFNVPLGDDLAFKLSWLGNRRDGFVENTGPGGDFGDREETALRADLRWLASDWLTADYSYDRTQNRYYNTVFQSVLRSETNHGQAETFKSYAQSQSTFSSRRLDALATGMPMAESGATINGHALTLTAPLGAFELKYIGAYRDLVDDQYADLGGGAGSTTYRLDTQFYDGPSAAMVNDGNPTPLQIPQVFQDQTSHELQLTGKLFDDSLEFIVGAFHFEENGGENGRPIHHILNTAVNPEQLGFLLGQFPELVNALSGTAGPQIVAYWDYEFGIHNTAEAYFGQATWTPPWFDERLHVTAGLRHSRDRREAFKDFFSIQYIEAVQQTGQGIAYELPAEVLSPGNDPFENVTAEREFTDTSPSFNLQYDLRDDVTVYLSAARAYKSGGFNVRDPQVSGDSGPASDDVDYGFGFVEGFAPEHVSSYEFGVKSEWMNRRLRLNADVFDSHYTNQQINFLISGTISDTKTRNVGRSRIKGFEMDGAFVMAPGLILALDYAYLDARTLDVRNLAGEQQAHLFPFISAPRHSFVTALDWTLMQFGPADLRAYLTWNYIGYRNGLVITEERRYKTEIDGYGLLGARVVLGGLQLGERGVVDVALWGRNLMDQEYELTAIDNLPQADRAVIWGEPRSLGLDLIYRFR